MIVQVQSSAKVVQNRCRTHAEIQMKPHRRCQGAVVQKYSGAEVQCSGRLGAEMEVVGRC